MQNFLLRWHVNPMPGENEVDGMWVLEPQNERAFERAEKLLNGEEWRPLRFEGEDYPESSFCSQEFDYDYEALAALEKVGVTPARVNDFETGAHGI